MSSYHSSFTFLNQNSYNDNGLIIIAFDADNGLNDTFLSTDQIITESYNGIYDKVYGSKYNSKPEINISVIKSDGTNFSVNDNRKILKWVTGCMMPSWLDLYDGDTLQYSYFVTCTNVQQFKLDARIIGMTLTFTSVKPFAYSPKVTIERNISGSSDFQINNETDDMFSYVFPNITFQNTSGSSLSIVNQTLNEETTISNLSINENITLDSNQFIITDLPNKIFGNNFNFVWPRLNPGINNFRVSGNGTIKFEYKYPIKIGDCAIDIETFNGNINYNCN